MKSKSLHGLILSNILTGLRACAAMKRVPVSFMLSLIIFAYISVPAPTTFATSEEEVYLPRYLGNSDWRSSFPCAINEAGQVVGYGLTVNSEWHAFFWEDEVGMIDLGTLGGIESRATSINENGEVVGWSTTKSGRKLAFLWKKNTGMVALEPFNYEGQAIDINDEGTLTGSSSFTLSPRSVRIFVDNYPSFIDEPNSIVTFSLTICNELFDKKITITSLVDSVYGDLNGKGTCSLPQTIEPLEFYECSYSVLVSGQAGETCMNTITATGIDELNNEVVDSENALVYIRSNSKLRVSTSTSGVFPIREPGAERMIGVTLYNMAELNPEDPDENKIKIKSIIDSVYGDLNKEGIEIRAGSRYSFSYPGLISGMAGDTFTHTVTAVCTDITTGAEIRDSDSWSTNIHASWTHACIWQKESGRYEIMDLGTLGDPALDSRSIAINNNGIVLGDSRLADGYYHPFLWEQGLGIQEIVLSNRGEAVALNDFGQVTGNYFPPYPPGGSAPFFWDGSSVHYLGTLGGRFAKALGLNNGGCIVGASQVPVGPYIIYHAFAWLDGTYKDLADSCPEGMRCQYARDVNDNGIVVGGSDFGCAFVWTEEAGVLPLRTLGGAHSSAFKINEDGFIVGTSSRADHPNYAPHHATLWRSVDSFTTVELFEYLFDKLQEYEDEGFVKSDPLYNLLVNAKKLFEKGNYDGVRGCLNAFMEHTDHLVKKGDLRLDQAQWFSIASNAIIVDLPSRARADT